MKLVIGANEYLFEQGAVITEQINVELDKASLLLPPKSSRLILEPYTKARIEIESNIIYMCVSEITNERESVDPEIWVDRLELIEETKWLEGFKVSHKAFTQPTDFSTRYTYKSALERLRDISVYSQSNFINKPYELSSDFNAPIYLDRMPQSFLMGKNLREQIDYILKPLNKQCRLKNGLLYVDDFNKREEINSGEQTIKVYDSMVNYASYLEMDAKNLINEQRSSQATKKTAWLSPVTDSGNLTDVNGYFEVGDRIDKIIKVEAIYRVSGAGGLPDNSGRVVNLTNYVVEQSVWTNLVPHWPSNGIIDSGTPVKDFPYQANRMSYKRHGTRIENAFNRYKNGSLTIQTAITIKEAIRTFYIDNIGDLGSDNTAFHDYVIRVEYVPYQEERIRVRDTSKTNDIGLQVNQGERVIELNSVGKHMRSTIERLGNPKIEITKTCQFIERYKPYQTFIFEGKTYSVVVAETQIFTEQVSSRAYLYENFQISDRVGVNQEDRQYEIGDKILRNEIYEEYIKFELGNTSLSKTSLITNDGILAFGKTLRTFFMDDALNRDVNYVIWRNGNDRLLIPCNSTALDNSLKFTFGFSDAIIAGDSLTNQAYQISDSGWYKKGIKYTDADGIIDETSYFMCNDYDFGSLVGDAERGNYIARVKGMPLAEEARAVRKLFDFPLMKMIKDPSEIMQFTFQMHIISDDKIIVGDYFLRRNQLTVPYYSNTIGVGNQRVYISAFDEYKKGDTKPLGAALSGLSYSWEILGNGWILLTVTGLEAYMPFTSWGIGNQGDNQLLLGVNSNVDKITIGFRKDK